MYKLSLSHQNFSVCSGRCLSESQMKAIGLPSGFNTNKDLGRINLNAE